MFENIDRINLTGVFLVFVILGLFTGLNSFQDPSNFLTWESQMDRPNIIIIDLDRLSKNRMQCYGYSRNTMPNTCSFGENNIIFDNAVSQSSWTVASVGSLFTGQYVGSHDVANVNDSLSENSLTVAEYFGEDYSTVAFPGSPDRNPKFLKPSYNLDQGFDEYNTGNYDIREHMPEINRFLEEKADRPFFMYVQSYAPHDYLTEDGSHPKIFRDNYSDANDLPERARNKTPSDIALIDGQYQFVIEDGRNVNLTEDYIEHVNKTYDDIIYHEDKAVGRLLDELKEQGEYSDSIIIITANHGEVTDTRSIRGDERFGHGSLSDDVVNVPFMVHIPGSENSRRIQTQIEFVDVFPTLVDLTGLNKRSLDEKLQGDSFISLLNEESGKKFQGELAFSTSYNYNLQSVRNNSWKYVKMSGDERLFNLKSVPAEKNNVIDKYPDIAKSMRSSLEQKQVENKIFSSSR
jgi:arylsulfatase A-like enzyme